MTLVIGRAGAADVVHPLAACDVDELVAMHARCSPQTRYARWHGHTKRFPPSYLTRLLSDDLAVVARRNGTLIGFASAARVDDATWEIGLLVEDAWQHRGVGGQLLTEIVERAREDGAQAIRAEVLEQDAGLVQPLRALGALTARASRGVLTADVRLSA